MAVVQLKHHYKYYVSDITHRPVCISKHNASEAGLCLRLHVKLTQLGPIDGASPYLRTPVPTPR
jgi:hypothetical protein